MYTIGIDIGSASSKVVVLRDGCALAAAAAVQTGTGSSGPERAMAQALAQADILGAGILVCGYRYVDMMYSELHDCLPPHFEMLLVASRQVWSECTGNDIVCVSMPIQVQDLLNTLEMMVLQLERQRKLLRQKPKVRSREEEKTVLEAKRLLMERNNMSEEKAHRYLQKCSMDGGRSLAETARMVLSMMDF